ncbi:hypothetical protein TSTA_101990 [Talaromyces stipitatus ATCC 10500]|uniref:HAT C-terminal dimerisation domain-containing protein n=1 Tax=Talaromyces stipitatus (strain ATCC 10500 / CBS 375.48 / QM 6759 / NRRL 1006) TaxID=441959 RepID=B8MN14_TALSN|nr:uncharacterized protein TSTA_101990 [Talaromyces stipitatus ATCC 10500]EED13963.1 hypothetical protein TSTA_101990 [Talaromyces stipitatus ATCC 10500]
MDKFTKKMDSNIIYYVAAILDPRVKTSFIRAQISKSDADVIVSDIHLSSKMWSYGMIEDGDPDWILKWWKVNVFNYPLILKAVQDYLPILSAEVGVKRLFSNA